MRSKLLFFFQAEDGIRSLYVTEFRRVLFRSWSDSIGSPSAAASGPATGLDASPRSRAASRASPARSEEHTSELQSRRDLVCRLLLEKKNIVIDGRIRLRLNFLLAMICNTQSV